MDFNALFSKEDITEQFDLSEIQNLKVVSVIAYIIPLLFFLPKLTDGNSNYATFVSNQSFKIFILDAALSILSQIPLLGFIFKLLLLAVILIQILGVIDTVNMTTSKLPVVGAIPVEVFK